MHVEHNNKPTEQHIKLNVYALLILHKMIELRAQQLLQSAALISIDALL